MINELKFLLFIIVDMVSWVTTSMERRRRCRTLSSELLQCYTGRSRNPETTEMCLTYSKSMRCASDLFVYNVHSGRRVSSKTIELVYRSIIIMIEKLQTKTSPHRKWSDGGHFIILHFLSAAATISLKWIKTFKRNRAVKNTSRHSVSLLPLRIVRYAHVQ